MTSSSAPGYLHVTGVFDEGEMAAVSVTWTPPRPCTRAATADRGGRATAPATICLVRMQHFDDVSPAVERLVGDERLQRLARSHG